MLLIFLLTRILLQILEWASLDFYFPTWWCWEGGFETWIVHPRSSKSSPHSQYALPAFAPSAPQTVSPISSAHLHHCPPAKPSKSRRWPNINIKFWNTWSYDSFWKFLTLQLMKWLQNYRITIHICFTVFCLKLEESLLGLFHVLCYRTFSC